MIPESPLTWHEFIDANLSTTHFKNLTLYSRENPNKSKAIFLKLALLSFERKVRFRRNLNAIT